MKISFLTVACCDYQHWDSIFKTVDAAGLKKMKNAIYCSDPLQVHAIHKPETARGYYQVEPVLLKQGATGDNRYGECVQETCN